jgi:hypothetical protein
MQKADVNSFPDWDEAVKEYRNTRDPAAREAFENRLRGASYLSAEEITLTETDVSLLGGRKNLYVNRGRAVVTASDGRRFLPFCTSESEFSKMPPGGGRSTADFSAILNSVAADAGLAGAIINPVGWGMLVLTRRELNRIAGLTGDAGGAGAPDIKSIAKGTEALTPEMEGALSSMLGANPRLADTLKSYAGGNVRLNSAGRVVADKIVQIKGPAPPGVDRGSPGVPIELGKSKVELLFAKAVPPGLGRAVAAALRPEHDARAVYYLLAKINDAKPVPFIAADFGGYDKRVCAAIAGAAGRIMGERGKGFVVARAAGSDLERARIIGELIYSRDEGYISE